MYVYKRFIKNLFQILLAVVKLFAYIHSVHFLTNTGIKHIIRITYKYALENSIYTCRFLYFYMKFYTFSFTFWDINSIKAGTVGVKYLKKKLAKT